MQDLNYQLINSIEEKNWWYQGKRDLFDQILKTINRQFGSALDLGCGVGSNLTVLAKYSREVKGIDYSPQAVSFCRKKGYQNVLVGNVHHLNLRSQFDLVLCSELLEHVNDKKAVQEISKVLKKGGYFLFSVPAHQYLWNDNDDLSQHLRRYEKKELVKLLSTEFHILKTSYWNSTLFLPAFVTYYLQKKLIKKRKKKPITLI